MRRGIVAVAAGGIAVLGAGMLIGSAAGRSGTEQAAQERTLRIWVAERDINAGTSSVDALAVAAQRTVRASSALRGALTAPPAPGATTTRALFAGQPLTDRDFADTPPQTLPLAPGQIAVSVDLPDPSRVGGFVRPGSQVRVFRVTEADAATVVLGRAQVIATGSRTVASAASPPRPVPDDEPSAAAAAPPDSVVTLALRPDDARRVLSCAASGQLALGLLPPAHLSGGRA